MTAGTARKRKTTFRIYHRPDIRSSESVVRRNDRRKLMAVAAAVGVLAGVCFFTDSTSASEYIALRENRSIVSGFASDFILLELFVAVCFFGGMSLFGTLSGIIASSVRSVGAGAVAAYASGTVSAESISVIAFQAASAALVAAAAGECAGLSCSIASCSGDRSGDIQLYLKKFGIITFLAAAVSLADSAVMCFIH